MIKAFSDEAWEDFQYQTKQDKKTLQRILKILKDIDWHGYTGIGKPERLKGISLHTGVVELITPIVLYIELKMIQSRLFNAVLTIRTNSQHHLITNLSQ